MINATGCGVTSPDAQWLEYAKGQPVNYTGDINNVFACGQMVSVLRSAAEISAKPQLDPGTKLEMQCRTCPNPIPGLAVVSGCDY